MTADVPVVEVVAVDAVLDALDTPTSSEVYSAVEPFSNAAVAAAAAARAIAGGGGGSLPDPITTPINSAVADPNDVPLFIKLPAGFESGGYAAILIWDENEYPVLEFDVDGNLSVQVPPGLAGGVFTLKGDGDGIATAGQLTVNPGDAAQDSSIVLNAPAGRAAQFRITNAAGTYAIIDASANDGVPLLGFYDAAPVGKPSGVAVTAEAIHAALVSLGLIGA